MRPGMMPILHLPGEITPGQFGPTRRVLSRSIVSETRTMSRTGIPSVMQMTRGCAAADIEEVRWRTAGVLDDVHRGHGEASAVDHAADAAVELDVIEAVLRSFDFERVFFVEIAKAAKFLVTKQAVVIERHLGVKGDQLPIAGEDAGIDLEHGSVGIHEGAMQRLKKRRRVVGNVTRKPKAERKFARLIRLQPDGWMDNL